MYTWICWNLLTTYLATRSDSYKVDTEERCGTCISAQVKNNIYTEMC